MRARVYESVSVSACASRRPGPADTDHAELKKERKKIPFLGGRLQSGGGRQRRSRGRVMACRFWAPGDGGNPRRRGFALAPSSGGALHSGGD